MIRRRRCAKILREVDRIARTTKYLLVLSDDDTLHAGMIAGLVHTANAVRNLHINIDPPSGRDYSVGFPVQR